jgi:hypothetical protein
MGLDEVRKQRPTLDHNSGARLQRNDAVERIHRLHEQSRKGFDLSGIYALAHRYLARESAIAQRI